jgi:hypothetical protein
MIQLDLRKIGNVIENKKSWIRSEDVMVAAVFGTALYLPFDQLLEPIIVSAKPLNNGDKFPVAEICNHQKYYARLWPSFKAIHEHNQCIINILSGLKSELDVFCEFEKDLLIIEAKRPNAFFDKDQLKKYLEALSLNKKKRLWLLAVGKGTSVAKHISQLSLTQNYNILYVDWTTILSTIKNLSINRHGNIKYLLEDLVSFLSKRQLCSFEGFTWPKEIEFLNENVYQTIVEEEWLPHRPLMWPKLIKDSMVFKEFIKLPW